MFRQNTFPSALSKVFLPIVLLVGSSLHSQGRMGEIQLLVKDPSGAIMESSGRLDTLATGSVKCFETDSQGRVTLGTLPFGRYRLEVSRTGFATQSILIEVQSEDPISQVITLALGTSAYQVEVVGTTPLAGIDRSIDEIPAPTQAATERDMEQSGALHLSDFLNRHFNGVYLNEIQGNPFQADLNYRGYTASPLLGTPQGLSLYMDGVRLNQPFGDVVSWDLIPRIAIAETTLIPGSNPLFGLNTLGGAVSVQTKDGRSNSDTLFQVSGGSFGRVMGDFEHGGSNSKGVNWYLASSLFFEDGWRDDSPSNVRQVFGKLGWQSDKTVLGLTTAYFNNSLIGNGLQEERFLDRDYASVYTKPDITANRSPFLNFTARHSPTNRLTFSGNGYYRFIRTNTLNGDINEDSLDQSLYQLSAADIRALTQAGYTGFPTTGANAANTPFPFWGCIAQALQADEPSEKCNGLLNRTNTRQHNYGASGQMSWFGSLGGHGHQFTAGGVYDRSNVGFLQSTQLGYLNPDRSVTGVNAFGDSVTGGDVDGEPYDARVDLGGIIHTASVYATDTLSVGSRWNLTLSGRYNRTVVDNDDRLHQPGPGSLTSHNVFDRFNPAAGVTFRLANPLSVYLGYSEGNRAPTSIELGCADPEQPCKLPNAMAGDPPLQHVVTRTIEVGVRGDLERNIKWNAGWFRADNRNDILFVASEQTGFGYFKNFGKTLRQGVDLGLTARIWRFSLGTGYTFLDATYRSPETVNGAGNSTNDEAAEGEGGLEGIIEIEPGNRIPLIPQHMLKGYADIQITSKLSADISVLAVSSSYARGNENNLHEATVPYYLGPGTSPGYGVVNLGGRYQFKRWLQFFAQVNNLFNRRFYSAAQLGPTGFTETGNFIARPFPAVNGEFPVQQGTFFAPGAPIGVWGGVRFTF